MAKRIGKLSKRYASAFLKAIADQDKTSGSPSPAQKLAQELTEFSALWRREHDLPGQLLSPMFARADREKALAAICNHLNLSPLLTSFLKVLFERDRLGFVGEIAQSFTEAADQAAGAVRVTVTTARAILADEQQRIEKTITPRINGKPQFKFEVNAELIGGMIVRYSGQVLDASISGRLLKMEQGLLA